jgi:hypothetical protein
MDHDPWSIGGVLNNSSSKLPLKILHREREGVLGPIKSLLNLDFDRIGPFLVLSGEGSYPFHLKWRAFI